MHYCTAHFTLSNTTFTFIQLWDQLTSPHTQSVSYLLRWRRTSSNCLRRKKQAAMHGRFHFFQPNIHFHFHPTLKPTDKPSYSKYVLPVEIEENNIKLFEKKKASSHALPISLFSITIWPLSLSSNFGTNSYPHTRSVSYTLWGCFRFISYVYMKGYCL